jgi:1-acyl-sn-glycerol-3-phosphate acyltransferase
MIQKLCHYVFFKMLGWRLVGEVPVGDKFVFATAPHTSNWDFVYGWLASRALDLNLTIFAKDVFFIGPLKYICKFFGVAPVNRRKSTNFVDSVARQFAESETLIAVITPEGTRSFNPQIKSGYYYLAKKANVPIVLAGPDFKAKTFNLSPPRAPMPTFEEDAEDLIAFCKRLHAHTPEYTFQ